jgi:hypothetical protein
MSTVRRVIAEQAHAVPQRAYTPNGLFDRSVTTPGRVTREVSHLDEGGNYTPPGSTAQNGFQEVKWYRCRDCQALVRETHLESHTCEELAP